MTKTVEQLAREERKAYFKAWRANNKEKVKKHNATYWERRAERKLSNDEESKLFPEVNFSEVV